MFNKFISQSVILCFLFSFVAPSSIFAEGAVLLPKPGELVNLSAAFQPALLTGVKIHPENPFLLEFIMSPGDKDLSGSLDVKAEGKKLINYFLAALAIPEKEMWVNLSPYEKSRIIPKSLSQTKMGHELLAQDYLLKQITASLIYPKKGLGQEFWNRVYALVQQQYGNVQIPINTFNKVWIVGDRAQVYVKNNVAYVTDCHLKVMLEEDYLALSQNNKVSARLPKKRNAITSQIIRDLILPELEREVNQGKNFANLRQIFYSLILAGWYKNNLKASVLNQVYSNKETMKGIESSDANAKQRIYNQYLQAYKKGVFNFVKDVDLPNGTSQPMKYFSGGVVPGLASNPTVSKAMTSGFGRLMSRGALLITALFQVGRARVVSAARKTGDKDGDSQNQEEPAPAGTQRLELMRRIAKIMTGSKLSKRDLLHYLDELINDNFDVLDNGRTLIREYHESSVTVTPIVAIFNRLMRAFGLEHKDQKEFIWNQRTQRGDKLVERWEIDSERVHEFKTWLREIRNEVSDLAMVGDDELESQLIQLRRQLIANQVTMEMLEQLFSKSMRQKWNYLFSGQYVARDLLDGFDVDVGMKNKIVGIVDQSREEFLRIKRILNQLEKNNRYGPLLANQRVLLEIKSFLTLSSGLKDEEGIAHLRNTIVTSLRQVVDVSYHKVLIPLLDRARELYVDDAPRSTGRDQAQINGGIDLNADQLKLSIKGDKAQIVFNAKDLEQLKRNGLESLSPEILKITPIDNIMAI